jgi:RNA polymerase sigma factor (TIGR02999 family)
MTRPHEPDAARLLPVVYDELRRLAAANLAREPDGHTLDATALVHEAYLRLGEQQAFSTRTDFFRAAAGAMRRVLVDHARAKRAAKRGGQRLRVEFPDVPDGLRDPDLVDLDDALTELERRDPTAAELVTLRYFSGLSHVEAAEALGLTRRQADGVWAVARAWLFRRLRAE